MSTNNTEIGGLANAMKALDDHDMEMRNAERTADSLDERQLSANLAIGLALKAIALMLMDLAHPD